MLTPRHLFTIAAVLTLAVACTATIPPMVMHGRFVTSPGPDGSTNFTLYAERVEPIPAPTPADAGVPAPAPAPDAAAPTPAPADAGVVADNPDAAPTSPLDASIPIPQPGPVLSLGLGTNLGGNYYWSGTWNQLNAWQQGREFTDQWGSVAIIPWRAPNTQRVITWTGDGAVTEIHGRRPSAAEQAAKRFVYTSPSSGNPWGVVRASGNLGQVRDVELAYESHTSQWHPAFLADLDDYSVLRFMDWGETNHSPQTTWSSRPQPNRDFPGETGGVAYEDMIALANATGKHMWVCVPHMADDAYVLALAQLLAAQLNPGLRVIIEYSNEIWNGMFTQFAYAGQQGLARGLSSNEHEARLRFVGVRTREVAAIMRPVLGDRMIVVAPGQGASTWVSRTVLTACGDVCQALAVAPYFMQATEASVDESIGWIRDQHAIAQAAGIPLIAYEGGQHLLGDSCAEPNRAASMGALYDRYLAGWAASGAGLFAHFNDAYRFGSYGCWGALESHGQSGSPKRDALRRAAEAWRR